MAGDGSRRWTSRLLSGVVRGAVRAGLPAPRVILTYHDVGEVAGAVPAAAFTAQLQGALQAGYTFVPLTAMTDWAAGRGRLPARAAALTFDDGLASTARVAGPILRRLGLPATVFPVLEFLGGPRRFGSLHARAILAADDGMPGTRPWEYMTWGELDAWVAGGGEVGGHTLTHPFLGDLAGARGRDEVALCRRRLRERYGRPPAVFCYPFGDASGGAVGWVRAAGFAAAVTTAAGVVRRGAEPLLLPRVPAPVTAGAAFEDLLFGTFHHRRRARRLLGGGAA